MRCDMERKIQSTVVIPNYNGIRYIENCLTALAGEPAHVIVVDNGSDDGSRELVREKFPRVELICLDRNYGFCKAVNVGMEHSNTTYVILLNSDTKAEAGFVRALEQPLMRHSEIFSGAAQIRSLKKPELTDDAGDFYCALGWAFARGKDKPYQAYQQMRRIFAGCGAAVIYRRNILNEIGMMDENHFAYLEDIDLGYRARINGYDNVYIPKAVVYHAGSAVSGSRHNSFKVRLSAKNSVYLAYKNMPLCQLLLNMPFLFAGFVIKQLYFVKKGLGKDYFAGVCEGIRLCRSGGGRAHKVRFQRGHLRNYIVIQWELWRNMYYRFMER